MTVLACLFDLGNVVVDWDPLRLYASRFETEQAARDFLDHVCTLDWHTAHDRGVSMDDNAAALISRYPQYAEHILAWNTGWLDMFHGYVPGVAALIAQLEEARLPLFALTNLPAEKAEETFSAFPMIRVFRDIIISGVEGMVKPDQEIFRLTLDRIGFAADDVLFIDDRAENTEAARSLGFHVHTFSTASSLADCLRTHALI